MTADTEEVSVTDKQAWFYSHTPQRPIYVYSENDQVLAWLSYKPFYGRVAYEGTVEISIYITAKAQGKGLGKTRTIGSLPKRKLSNLNIKVLLCLFLVIIYPVLNYLNTLILVCGASYHRWLLWIITLTA